MKKYYILTCILYIFLSQSCIHRKKHTILTNHRVSNDCSLFNLLIEEDSVWKSYDTMFCFISNKHNEAKGIILGKKQNKNILYTIFNPSSKPLIIDNKWGLKLPNEKKLENFQQQKRSHYYHSDRYDIYYKKNNKIICFNVNFFVINSCEGEMCDLFQYYENLVWEL